MRRMKLLLMIIRRSGTGEALLTFLVVFLVCAAIVMVFEPSVTHYTDALWFLWAVSTTVGLGDITAVTVAGRAATVICSIMAIITTAIFTGALVDFFREVRHRQLDESLTEFMDKLERLPELDQEELKRISKRIRTLRK